MNRTITTALFSMLLFLSACGGTKPVVVVPPPTPQVLQIVTPSLPPAKTQVVYNQQLVASGGVPPYSWAITAGSLPPGVILTSLGVLKGIPTVGGTFPITIRVTDSSIIKQADRIQIEMKGRE